MSKALFVEVEEFERKLLEERCGKRGDMGAEFREEALEAEKAIITPHNAFNSVEAITRIAETTVENIAGFFEGRPQNIISY